MSFREWRTRRRLRSFLSHGVPVPLDIVAQFLGVSTATNEERQRVRKHLQSVGATASWQSGPEAVEAWSLVGVRPGRALTRGLITLGVLNAIGLLAICFVGWQLSRGLVMPGAVVAFDREQGCPADGWIDVGLTDPDRFSGRMLIAVGPEGNRPEGYDPVARQYRETGGAETRRLSEAQMPPHRHEVVWRTGGTQEHTVSLLNKRTEVEGDNQYKLEAPQNAGQPGRNLETTEAGLGEEFSIMPPFVAVHFCKRDGG